MIVYRFYLWDVIKGYELFGKLPERRRDPERITEDSIINLGKTNYGKNVRAEHIFFVRVDFEEGEKEDFRITYQ